MKSAPRFSPTIRSELGSAYHDGIIGGATQSIVAIEVWNGTTLVSSWVRADGATMIDGISYAFDATNDDGVILQGLLVDYRVEFHVGVVDANDTGKLDRFSVQNVSAGGAANDTFDLGDIRLGGQDADSAEVGSHINFEDDGPTQSVTAGTMTVSLELDETSGAADHYAAGETADTYVNDDVAGALAQRTTAVTGGLAALFTASGSYGSDLAGTLTPAMSFVGVPAGGLATSLSATNGGAITLFADSATQLSGKDTDGHTVFTIAIVDVGAGVLQLRTTLFEALDNGNDALFDEAVDLLLPNGALELQYQITRSDAEGDTIVASDKILLADDNDSVFSFDDDGPTQTVTAVANAAAQLEVSLDETTGATDRYAAGETADTYVNDDVAGALAQRTTAVTGGLVALFTASGSYGSDLAGTLTPAMSFVGVPAGGLATSLSATNGGAITLFADSATQLSGKDTDGHTVFTIAIVDVGAGVLQLRTTLFEALDNGNDALFDEAVDLLLPNGALELQYQITRSDAEGDTIVASDKILLADDNDSVFSFDDDGPLALQPVSSSIKNAVGESVTAALDNGSPTPFSANFGSDGPFASYGGLVFTGLNGDNDGGTGWVNGDTLKDASGNALTSNKQSIYLSGFGTNVLTAYVGTDPAATGAKVFTMTLNSNGTYTMEMFAKIDDGSFDFDNFATARAGNFTWLGVSGDEYPEKDLLVTGGVPNLTEVNNDSDDLAANNQWIDPVDPDDPSAIGELLRLDFVNLGISTNRGGADISTIPTATHYDANNVGFTIMQTLAGRAVDVRISAFDVTGGLGGADIATDLTTGTLDKILAVTVISDSRLAPTGDPDGVTYLRSAGEVQTLNGVTRWVSKDTNGNVVVVWDENYDINNADEVAQNGDQAYVTVLNLEGAVSSRSYLRDKVFVSTADGFNRLEIMNAEQNGSKDAFAIGDIEVGAVGQEIDLAFNGKIVDGDGDANTIGLIGVTLTPDVLG